MITIPRATVDLVRAPTTLDAPAWEPVDRETGIYSAEHGPSLHSTLAHVRCGHGHVLRVSGLIHSIAPDGTLSPSWVCTVPGCGWHVYVRLDGWQP